MNIKRKRAISKLKKIISMYEADIDKDTNRYDVITAPNVMLALRYAAEDIEMSLTTDTDKMGAIRAIENYKTIATW